MEYKKLTTQSPEYSKAEKIYIEAFPEPERPKQFRDYVTYSENNNDVHVVVAVDENNVAGFYITFDLKEIYYLLFFAVNGAIRGKGYGTQIFQHILEEHKDKPACGGIETLVETAPNYEQRVARKRFYERNNMQVLDSVFYEGDMPYNLIVTTLDYDFAGKREEIAAQIIELNNRI